MANSIVTSTLLDGSRNTIIKVDIIGDGSGDETGYLIFNASLFTNKTVNKKVVEVQYSLDEFSASLYWDATVDQHFLTLEKDHYSEFIFDQGLNNIGIAGHTGNILLKTSGLASGDNGYIIIYIKHKRD